MRPLTSQEQIALLWVSQFDAVEWDDGSIGLLAVDLGLGEILIDKLANRIPMRPDILERADAVMARELTIEVSSNPKKERGERQ